MINLSFNDLEKISKALADYVFHHPQEEQDGEYKKTWDKIQIMIGESIK